MSLTAAPGRMVILHDPVPQDAPPEQHDTLVQAGAVRQALQELGIASRTLAFEPNLAVLEAHLNRLKPVGVFNLVESVNGNDALAHIAPAWLDAFGVPYTGCGPLAMMVTSDKRYAKRLMNAAGIAAPEDFPGVESARPDSRWIVKALQMDASLGLDEHSVVGPGAVAGQLARCQQSHGGQWFAERYIEGREFNLALLQTGERVRVLPCAEIVFTRYAQGRPRIVDYRAKWQPESFEYINTQRVFPERQADGPLMDRLAAIAIKCWNLFQCRGYARVDLRVDQSGRPWVLEVNANPCLAPDAGFAAALEQTGLSYSGAIRAIIQAAGIRAIKA